MESKEEQGKRGGKRKFNTNITKLFLIYINSRLIKYEPARFRPVRKPGRNQFRLSLMVTGKSPNSTGTLTLFLGLCPTLVTTFIKRMHVHVKLNTNKYINLLKDQHASGLVLKLGVSSKTHMTKIALKAIYSQDVIPKT